MNAKKKSLLSLFRSETLPRKNSSFLVLMVITDFWQKFCLISIILVSFLNFTGLFFVILRIELLYPIFSSRKAPEKLFSPKYRGKVLLGDVAEVAEEISWIAKRIKGRSNKLLRDRFPQLKEWCPGHFWAPSCYHGSVGHGWEVVEKYISGQKGYDKTDTAPLVVIDEEKENLRAHKTWYVTLYNKLFGGKHQK